jgi:ABC-type Fe3+/spermidine/putrescine transport system ATPase subunit
VAQFLGDSNFLPGTVRQIEGEQCVVETAVGNLTGIPAGAAFAKDAGVLCSIRPHALNVDGAGAGPNVIPARLRSVTFLGDLLHLEVIAAGETLLQVVSLPASAARWQPGQTLTLSVQREGVIILPPE